MRPRVAEDVLADGLLMLAAAVLSLRHQLLAFGARRLRLAGPVKRFATTPSRLGVPRRASSSNRGGHNRTQPEVELVLCRLHVDAPHLGPSQLRLLLMRVEGVALSVTTVTAILNRRRELVVRLEDGRRKAKRTVDVSVARSIWGIDFTLVWVLGVMPVWLLGVIDYQGSRVIALRPVVFVTSGAVVSVLEEAFGKHEPPARLVSDNGSQFTAGVVRDFLRARGVEHRRIRPAHPWTNGRIERLFRTLKELHRFYVPVCLSVGHVGRFCEEFVGYYNECRPHSRCLGFTPDEVFRGETVARPGGRRAFFDGQLIAHRFT